MKTARAMLTFVGLEREAYAAGGEPVLLRASASSSRARSRRGPSLLLLDEAAAGCDHGVADWRAHSSVHDRLAITILLVASAWVW